MSAPLIEQYANGAQTTLNGGISSSVASLTATSAVGFPTSGNFRILIDDELILVTGLSGSGNVTWAITRGVEGTTAASHSSAATITQIMTAQSFLNLIGDGITSDLTANQPTEGRAGRIFFPSDGDGVFYMDNGSNWLPWGPIYPLTLPVLSNFTWLNQGSYATASQNNGGLYLADSGSDTANALRALVVATGTLSSGYVYNVTMAFIPSHALYAYCNMGLVLYESSNGKAYTFNLGVNSGNAPLLNIEQWSSVSLFSSGIAARGSNSNIDWSRFFMGPLVWLQIVETIGGTRYYNISNDGINWMTYYSESSGTWIAPDHYGFYVNTANSAGYGCAINVLHWNPIVVT